MTKTAFRSAAVAALALASTSAFAQARYAAPVAPSYVVPADEVDAEVVPPNAMGLFTCAYNERRTHLARQNCGGTRYDYGR